MGECFLLNLKTCKDHDTAATVDCCSHYTVAGLENCLAAKTAEKDQKMVIALSPLERVKIAIAMVVIPEYGKNFNVGLADDSDSQEDTMDADSSFRTDFKVTEQLDQIFMDRKRFLQRIFCFIIDAAAPIIMIGLSFDILILPNCCRLALYSFLKMMSICAQHSHFPRQGHRSQLGKKQFVFLETS